MIETGERDYERDPEFDVRFQPGVELTPSSRKALFAMGERNGKRRPALVAVETPREVGRQSLTPRECRHGDPGACGCEALAAIILDYAMQIRMKKQKPYVPREMPADLAGYGLVA